jgi:hypothetical protein
MRDYSRSSLTGTHLAILVKAKTMSASIVVFMLLLGSRLRCDDLKEYIYLDGKAVVVETVAQAAGCVFTLSTASVSLAAGGGSGSVTVTCTGSGSSPWMATSNVSWIMVTNGSAGTGTGAVTYAVAANTDYARSGTITIAGKMFTVTQASGISCQQTCAIQLNECGSEAAMCPDYCEAEIYSNYPECQSNPNMCMGMFYSCIEDCENNMQASCASQYNQCMSSCN